MILSKKRGIIMGIGNDRSIATAVAEECVGHGAEVIFSYHPVVKSRVEEIAGRLGAKGCFECDVSSEDSIVNFFSNVENIWSEFDFVVHAIAFANKANLSGEYLNYTKGDFNLAMDVSVFSFTSIMQKARKFMKNGGSAITYTYYGAEKIVPNYNIMGVAKAALESSVRYLAGDLGKENIRVNSVSSGPIKTLAASAIGDFKVVLKSVENNSPLRRNVTAEDVAKTSVFLLSDLASGVTAQNIKVDCGYSEVVPLNNSNE